MSMTRRLLAVLSVLAMAVVVVARADEPGRAPADVKAKASRNADFDNLVKEKHQERVDTKAALDDAALKQARLAEQFREFEAALLRLSQRLESSSKPEDQQKAVILRKAMQTANDVNVENKFSRLVDVLRKSNAITGTDLDKASQQNKELAQDLRTILAILLTDNRDAELKAEKERLTRMLEELKRVIRDQNTVRAMTERGTMEKNALGKSQAKVTQATDAIARGVGKEGQGAEANKGKAGDLKGEGKPGDPKGESKNDAKEAKGNDKEGKDGPKADNKGEGANGDKQDKEAKGDGKGEGSKSDKESKAGGKGQGGKNDKDGKADAKGEGAQGDKNDKAGAKGEGKEGNKNDKADAKGVRAREEKAESKDQGDKKDANKADAKGEGKPAPSKEGQNKDGQKGDGKGKADGKGEGKGQQGQSKSGNPSQGGQAKGQQGQQQPGGNKSNNQQQQPPGNQQPAENTPGKKQIQDAKEEMKKAEDKIAKGENDKASDEQSKAIEDLEAARKKLEELLKQLREEEIERLLAALQQQCEKMLALQIEVHAGTVDVAKAIADNRDKKPARADEQKSLDLSEHEDVIVALASKAKGLLETEGSAIAFPEVFGELEKDMMNVSRRLRKTDAGQVTQTIENDIIDTLKEMIEALKKARENNNSKQKPQQAGQQGQPQDQKLVDILAELRMIRSMEVRVYNRTKTYSEVYPELEQAPAAGDVKTAEEREKAERVLTELKDLADRQQKILEITDNIAKGKNRAN